MRKIEERMLAAVRQRKSWQERNTAVNYNEDNDSVTVFLHGNRIAQSDPLNPDIFVPDLHILNKFPTRTTFSRLRALGFEIRKVAFTGMWSAETINTP